MLGISAPESTSLLGPGWGCSHVDHDHEFCSLKSKSPGVLLLVPWSLDDHSRQGDQAFCPASSCGRYQCSHCNCLTQSEVTNSEATSHGPWCTGGEERSSQHPTHPVCGGPPVDPSGFLVLQPPPTQACWLSAHVLLGDIWEHGQLLCAGEHLLFPQFSAIKSVTRERRCLGNLNPREEPIW